MADKRRKPAPKPNAAPVVEEPAPAATPPEPIAVQDLVEVCSPSMFDPERRSPIIGTVVEIENGRIYFQVGNERRPRSLITSRLRKIGSSKQSLEDIKAAWAEALKGRQGILAEKERILASKQQPV